MSSQAAVRRTLVLMVLLVRAARAMYDELEKTAESERPLRAWP